MDKTFKSVGAIIDAAQAVLSFAKRFVEKNTPESALLAALFAAYEGSQNGIPVSATIILIFTALMTFAVAESAKDRTQISAGVPGAA